MSNSSHFSHIPHIFFRDDFATLCFAFRCHISLKPSENRMSNVRHVNVKCIFGLSITRLNFRFHYNWIIPKERKYLINTSGKSRSAFWSSQKVYFVSLKVCHLIKRMICLESRSQYDVNTLFYRWAHLYFGMILMRRFSVVMKVDHDSWQL